MEFHPLADLFPLIEGSEFEDLALSILEHGLREPITLYEGLILDGRNRYRACETAGVEPRFEKLAEGDDPYSFVIDKNVHRRHLNESQRAMIAAQIATRQVGGDHAKFGKTKMPPTVEQAAKLLNVGKDSVVSARRVLKDGTEEEIAAVKAGTVRVSSIYDQIRDNIPPKERRIERRTIHSRRQETLQAKGQLWGQLRDALVNLTSLPDPAEIVPIARSMDKRAGHLVDARLLPSLQWLKGFAHEWSNRDTVAEREKSSASYHADTGTGD